MPNKETLIQDLNDICRQTNARWLCCADIYTSNISEDEAKFLEAFRQAGFLKKDILVGRYAALEYGGGLRFNYSGLIEGGYAFPVSEKYKALAVFAGFETDFDQITVYHECAHLYQRKLSLFSKKENSNDKYRKYLKEVHANTFASMVMLLRAEDVLTFKKQQLYCLASDIQTFNQRSKKNIFYISLPITLELVKAVRSEGRSNMANRFSKNGNLDFEKIALYTADFVKKHAYTSFEFYQIINNMPSSSYDILRQKAKAWHQLGERYVSHERQKVQNRKDAYQLINAQRRAQTQNKIKPLPETDEKAKIINAVCAIDILNTRLTQDFNLYADLDSLIEKNPFYLNDISNENKKKEALKICEQMAEIYQTWRKDLYFKKLYNKINHPDTRDYVWELKQKKELEILNTIQKPKEY